MYGDSSQEMMMMMTSANSCAIFDVLYNVKHLLYHIMQDTYLTVDDVAHLYPSIDTDVHHRRTKPNKNKSDGKDVTSMYQCILLYYVSRECSSVSRNMAPPSTRDGFSSGT